MASSVHRATEADIPFLIGVGERFYSMTPLASLAPFDATVLAATIRRMLESDDAVIFRDEGGTIGGIRHQLYLSKAVVAVELWWWSEGKGLPLLEAFISWAGSDLLEMRSIDGLRHEALDAFYRRKGFVKTEHSYVRVTANGR